MVTIDPTGELFHVSAYEESYRVPKTPSLNSPNHGKTHLPPPQLKGRLDSYTRSSQDAREQLQKGIELERTDAMRRSPSCRNPESAYALRGCRGDGANWSDHWPRGRFCLATLPHQIVSGRCRKSLHSRSG